MKMMVDRIRRKEQIWNADSYARKNQKRGGTIIAMEEHNDAYKGVRSAMNTIIEKRKNVDYCTL